MPTHDRILRTQDVAQLLGVTISTVLDKVWRGTLPVHLSATGTYRFRYADVRAYRSRRRPWQVRWAKERHL